MAIVALVVWLFTVAAGVYLLVTSTRPGAGDDADAPAPQPVPAGFAVIEPTADPAPGGVAEPAAAGVKAPADPKTIARTRFDPPSLTRAKAEPIPGGRALAEFSHPLLGLVGFGLFVGYVMTRAWILGAIALGAGAGAVTAGLLWAVVNVRASRQDPPSRHAMSFTPRLLLLHGAGAAITILLAALIVARA
jgi:hypothetical protein